MHIGRDEEGVGADYSLPQRHADYVVVQPKPTLGRPAEATLFPRRASGRATLIQQLVQNGMRVATDKLVSIAKSDPLVSNRRRAIQALAKFDDPRVKEALRELVGQKG